MKAILSFIIGLMLISVTTFGQITIIQKKNPYGVNIKPDFSFVTKADSFRYFLISYNMKTTNGDGFGQVEWITNNQYPQYEAVKEYLKEFGVVQLIIINIIELNKQERDDFFKPSNP